MWGKIFQNLWFIHIYDVKVKIWSIIKLSSISNMGKLYYIIKTQELRGRLAAWPLPLVFFSVPNPSWHEAKVISRNWQCAGKCTSAAVSNPCLLILHKPLPPSEGKGSVPEGQRRKHYRVLLADSGALVREAAASPAALPIELPTDKGDTPTLPFCPSALPYLFPFDSQCLKSLPHFLSIPF